MIRIACAQLHLTKDMEENYDKALLYLHKAKLAGAQLVCFPEGQLSEYTSQSVIAMTRDEMIGLEQEHA